MHKKLTTNIKRKVEMSLAVLLLITVSACQNTTMSSYGDSEPTLSQAEVQTYMASIKHYFNPH